MLIAVQHGFQDCASAQSREKEWAQRHATPAMMLFCPGGSFVRPPIKSHSHLHQSVGARVEVLVYAVIQWVRAIKMHTGINARHPAYLAAQLYMKPCPPAADSLP